MSNTISDEEFKYEIIKLIAYMISSARGLILEPKLYGPLRLIDSVSRLIEMLNKKKLVTRELLELKKKIDSKKMVLMSDKEKFVELLDELVSDVTRTLEKY